MPHLARGDAKLYYEDDGEGPAILLTHGFVASTGMWDGQVAAFKDRYRLIRWDMRGHGRTECPDNQAAYGQDITVADMRPSWTISTLRRRHRWPLTRRFHVDALQRLPSGTRARAHLARLRTGLSKWRLPCQMERTRGRPSKTILEEGYKALNGASEVPVSLQRSSEELAMAARGILAQVDAKVIDSLPTIKVPTLVIIGAETPTTCRAPTIWRAEFRAPITSSYRTLRMA